VMFRVAYSYFDALEATAERSARSPTTASVVRTAIRPSTYGLGNRWTPGSGR
jgi:hypothetical protein